MKNIIRVELLALLICLIMLTGCKGRVFAAGIIESSPAREENIAINAALTAQLPARLEFINGVAKITTGGRYILSGEHIGQILIETARNDTVELILNGASLHNPSGQAIFAPRSKSVELILADGTLNSISDGRHSDEENNAAVFIRNDLIISGSGTLNVTGNHHHGIRAQDFLFIKSGTINITANGDALRGRDGVIIESGEFNLIAGGDGIQSNNNSNPEYGYIIINGGIFNIQAGQDGIQGEKDVTVNDGSLNIKANDDGITAKGSVLITGGSINITNSYEGIEGLNVTITGGDVNIFARDDGINARDSEVNVNLRGRQMTRGARPPANENMYVRITGGNVNVHALRDGIDSNNNVFLEGGVIQISGPSLGMEGAIDFDGFLLITGGRLITAGSVLYASERSTQPVLYVTFDQQLQAGVNIKIRDAEDNTLLNYTALNSFRTSVFSSPDFNIRETYSLYINDQKTTDVLIGGIITVLGGNPGGRGRGGPGINPGPGGRGENRMNQQPRI